MFIALALFALDATLIFDAAVRLAVTHERPLLHMGLAICAAAYTSVLFSTEPPETEPLAWILTGCGTLALATLVFAYAASDAEAAIKAEEARKRRLADVRRRIAKRRQGR